MVKNKNNNKIILIAVVAVLAFFLLKPGGFQLGAFTTEGGNNANDECTFVTNIEPSLCSNFDDSNGWIAYDIDGDGTNEGLGRTNGACTQYNCNTDSSNVNLDTLGCKVFDPQNGQDLCVCAGLTYPRKYSTNDADATNAELICVGACSVDSDCSTGVIDSWCEAGNVYGGTSDGICHTEWEVAQCGINYGVIENCGGSGCDYTGPGGSAECQGTTCTDSSWSPATSTVCSGQSFTQTSNCGNTRTATGTKDCSTTCTDSSWVPSTSTICSGQSYTQTSNCGNTRTATGTMDCSSGQQCTMNVLIGQGAISRTDLGLAITSYIQG